MTRTNSSFLSRSLLVAGLIAGVPALAAASPAVPLRSSYVVVDDVGTSASAAAASDDRDDDDSGAPARAIVYLNRKGGTYRPGHDDAGANTSSIIARAVTLPAWNVSDASWGRIKGCFEGLVDRWHVEVTDVDPGDVPHYEVVVAGRPADAGQPAGYAGVAPFSSSCRAMPTAVVFTFAELLASSNRTVCEVAVHEFAHAIGLDHEYLCADPMSYLHGCGDKSFQDVAAPCGEGSPRECLCGGDTQNSVELLDARLGRAGTGNPAPTVAIAEPVADTTVAAGFMVKATAVDNAAVEEVELWIDGSLVARSDSGPFEFATDGRLAAGEHRVEIRAVDAGGAVGTQVIDVTIARPLAEAPAPAPEASATPLGCAAGGGGGGPLGAIAVAGMIAIARRRR
jgi:hypothetical protein